MNFIFPQWKNDWNKTQKYVLGDIDSGDAFRVSTEKYLDKKPDIFRILALGDSFTWGDGIENPDNIYTRILEKQLNDIPGVKTTEVVNFGKRGFTTANELELLKKEGGKFHPDMIIVQFFINDIEISGPDYYHMNFLDQFHVENRLIKNERMHKWLKEHSVLYAFLNYQYFTMQINFKIPKDCDAKEFKTGWSQYREAIEGLRRFSKAKGYKDPLLVIFPDFLEGKWTMETFPLKDFNEKVLQIARENGVQVLDLTPVFLGLKRDLKTFWAFPMDRHPNEEAHQIAAEAIKRYLVENQLIEYGTF